MRPGFAAPEVASRADVLRRLELAVTRRLDGRVSGDHATTHLGPGSERAGATRLRARRRRAPHRLEPHGPRGRDLRAPHRGRALGRHLDRRRPLGQPRLRHRRVGEARRRARRGRGVRPACTSAAATGSASCVCGGRPARAPTGPPGQAVVHGRARHACTTPSGSPRRPAASADARRRPALGQRRGAHARRAVVVVSDFLEDDDWALHLRLLGLHHDVVAVQVSDPRELELPDVGIVGVIDAETGRQRYVHTGSAALRARYAEAAARAPGAGRRTIHGSGAEIPAPVDRPRLARPTPSASPRADAACAPCPAPTGARRRAPHRPDRAPARRPRPHGADRDDLPVRLAADPAAGPDRAAGRVPARAATPAHAGAAVHQRRPARLRGAQALRLAAARAGCRRPRLARRHDDRVRAAGDGAAHAAWTAPRCCSRSTRRRR